MQPPSREIGDLLLLRRAWIAAMSSSAKFMRQSDIRAHHVRFEFELRGAGVGGARVGGSRAARSAAFSSRPQRSRLYERTGRAGVVPGRRVVERARAVVAVVGPALALSRRSVDVRRQRRARDAHQRLRFAHARRRDRERRAAGVRALDPVVQLRIAICAPPFGGRASRPARRPREWPRRRRAWTASLAILRGDASRTGTAGDC